MTLGLGRQDPHGPVVVLRNAAADRTEGSLRRRVRLRYRPRPPRHRRRAAPGCCRRTTICRVAIDYLFRNRPRWDEEAAVGKTVVSSALIDRVTAKLGRRLYEVPVGFKWFVDGLLDGALWASVARKAPEHRFSRIDGTVWTTDKDGIVPALLSAEITARTGRDPGELYAELTRELGEPVRRPRRGAGHRRAEAEAGETLAAAGAHHATGRREDRTAFSTARRATTRQSAASR